MGASGRPSGLEHPRAGCPFCLAPPALSSLYPGDPVSLLVCVCVWGGGVTLGRQCPPSRQGRRPIGCPGRGCLPAGLSKLQWPPIPFHPPGAPCCAAIVPAWERSIRGQTGMRLLPTGLAGLWHPPDQEPWAPVHTQPARGLGRLSAQPGPRGRGAPPTGAEPSGCISGSCLLSARPVRMSTPPPGFLQPRHSLPRPCW